MLEGLPDHITKKIKVCPERGCWLWQGELVPGNYGRLKYNGHRYMAHIFMYQWKTGKDTRGKSHDHLCVNPQCCNPDHIEPTTHQKNCKRKYRRRVYVNENGKIIRPCRKEEN